MSGAVVWILLLLAVALIALVVIWLVARRVKGGLDNAPAVITGARAALQLAPASATRLHELSAEPILLKQNEEGVRVQIEHRPMLPLMAFVGKDVSVALGEAAARVSEQWGPKWVVLLRVGSDGEAWVQRLS